MINTDKYEGHADGPWKIESYNQSQAFTGINFNMTHTEQTHLAMKNGREKEREATANLIADAPLLLAEVKQLREQNKLMVDYFRYMRDGGFTDADWRTVNEWIGDEEE